MKAPPQICTSCDTEVQEESFCEGCGCFVCDSCDQIKGLPWEHELQDHQEDPL